MSAAGLAVTVLMAVVTAVSAQVSAQLNVRGPDGSLSLPLESQRGFAVVSDSSLQRLGWQTEVGAQGVVVGLPGGVRIRLGFGTPFFHWDQDLLQLTDAPYASDGQAYIPVQVLIDFLPVRLDSAYRFDESAFTLEILDQAVWSAIVAEPEAIPSSDVPDAVEELDPEGSELPARDVPAESARSVAEPVIPLVIIDPGHGGRDPGAAGSSGRSEKDIALRIGRALARELQREGEVAVLLTRETDVLVPIWDRGKQATAWKGDRPGVFISLHANALPGQRSVRGFETYFLSEARTDHERRVAENENAPLALDGTDPTAGDTDLDFILRDIRNLDHQHWSSLLAESIQTALEGVHTGPSRGVKQAPFAVITNALMPAVLVELGFLTNRQDERLLSREDFQEGAARSMARAILDFFKRYPPGQGSPLPGGDR